MTDAQDKTPIEPDIERLNSTLQKPLSELGAQEGVLAALACNQWTSSRPGRRHPLTQNQLFEIPLQMRECAEKNVREARGVYGQYIETANQMFDLMATMVPSNPSTVGIRSVHQRIMRFTQQNVEASFSLASELAKAKDFQEVFDIQSRHVQMQVQAYSLQAQELGRLMVGAAQSIQLKQ